MGFSCPVGPSTTVSSIWKENAVFQPDYDPARREQDLARWHEGVRRSMGWARQ